MICEVLQAGQTLYLFKWHMLLTIRIVSMLGQGQYVLQH